MEIETPDILDPWVINEIEQLKGDVQDAEELVADTEADNDFLSEENRTIKQKYKDLTDDFNNRLTSANQLLSKKCITYSNLFDEYEKVLTLYVQQTGVSMVTEKLKRLRKDGDLSD